MKMREGETVPDSSTEPKARHAQSPGVCQVLNQYIPSSFCGFKFGFLTQTKEPRFIYTLSFVP